MIGTRHEPYTWESEGILAADLDADGTVLRVNAALERFAGHDPAGEPFADLVVAAQRHALARRLAAAGEDWRSGTFALQAPDGRPATDRAVWLRRAGDVLLLVAEPAVGEQERLVEKVLELNDDLVSAHREVVRQRERLRDQAERIRHLEAISSAGLQRVRLDDVLDDVLRAIAAAVGADRAAILLRDSAGRLGVHAALGGGPVADEVAGAVAADGRPRLAGDTAAVPLAVEGEVIGVLRVAADAQRFGREDLRLLEPAAERAAVAIGRAQVHERERRIAEILQRALLPDRLPVVDGLALAARFMPGSGVQVGGDWYDAQPLPSGEVAIAIGDVAGKGVRAAAMMGEVRSALRAYGLLGGAPHDVLERLNGLVARSDQMATVLLAVVDPRTGGVRYASAGHLPPLVVGPGGDARVLEEGRGAPLLVYGPGRGSGEARLADGERLVLYTDGLVERRDEAIDDGLARLLRVADGAPDAVGPLCDHLLEHMHPGGDGPRDDTAVIALSRGRTG